MHKDSELSVRGVFDVGIKKEAAGVYLGCGESMDFETESADNK
jgi:hypothetical protein